MRLTDITALARPIDPRYPTNLAIVTLSLVIAAGGTILRIASGETLSEGAPWGIGAGLATFLTWALARELDPDHNLSAFVAAGLLLAGLFWFKLPALMALLWLLVLLRVVNRTAGVPATVLDSLLVLGLGSWLAWQETWLYGVALALALLLDGQLPPARKRHLLLAGVAFAIALVASLAQRNAPAAEGLSTPAALGLAATAVLFLAVVASTRRLAAVGDATGEPLVPSRVRAAQIIALVTAALITWRQGLAGVEALLPLWAAMLGTAAYLLATSAAQATKKARKQ